MDLSLRLRKYLVMGSQDCSRNPEEILREAIAGGITAFQFREKGPHSLQGEEKIELGLKLRALCQKHDVLFIVNDDVELIHALQADGIHVGQDDQSVNDLRPKYPDLIIGLSVSNDEEVEKSPVELVDYLGAGPVFPTTTKHDASPVVGTSWLESLRSSHPHLPLVGIGGITVENARFVINAGADGVAVVSAITKAANVKEAVENL
ncbi:thiamine phosphate synthase [Halobacillus salinarum]|uniref:Thiamine-phosphate synthase n=1 Tax=Halobacillus salinarum TaxID=2932257 RepID=A0ABY4ELU7_9BACI|nr:thiamine phosphate synthase [Halobacillus salinarum]UOQ45103.1 thiamine phosphate synthase [Halobacillus salinarum]